MNFSNRASLDALIAKLTLIQAQEWAKELDKWVFCSDLLAQHGLDFCGDDEDVAIEAIESAFSSLVSK